MKPVTHDELINEVLHHVQTDPHKQGAGLSDFILGAQDGLVNVLGVVLGIAAATNNAHIVLVAGLPTTFAESISMGAVAYTTTLGDADLYQSESEREYRHVKETPHLEKKEVRDIYARKGFHGDLLSILLGSGGFYPGEPMTTEVYRPVRRLGNYVSVRLRGTASNRDAIGARVRLTAGGRTQHRRVSGGSGFGCLPLDQHFGVGSAARIEAVEIDWPSRRRQRVERIPVNAAIQIIEGQQGFQELKRA